jgi:L-iditol 2-dehydrogenase
VRQAHLTAPRTIEWRDSAAPKPGRGEVLVRIRAALTCGTDLKTYRRGHPKLQYGPFGHEASGDVVAIGKDFERFAKGDAIMWVQTAPCGSCEQCERGFENLCEHLFDDIALGAYGDELLLPANVVRQNVYKKPDKLSYIEAAFLEPFACVVHGWNVLRRADARRPLPSDVVIIGAGTIGLLHLIYAVRAGVNTTVIARGGARRGLASSLGAKTVIDAEDAPAIEALAGSAAAVIECAGTQQTWTQAAGLARSGGRVLLFSGLPSGAMAEFDAAKIHYGEIALLGAFHFTPADVREAYELLGRGGIDVKPLVSGVEKMEDIVDVFDRLDRREGYKFALVPEGQDPQWR